MERMYLIGLTILLLMYSSGMFNVTPLMIALVAVFVTICNEISILIGIWKKKDRD